MDAIELIKQMRQGGRGALAKVITAIENDRPISRQLINLIRQYTGNALLIGITGPPGAGKSTLINGLTAHYRQKGFRVGIVAVDPSSPFTGGALLGDRVRMNHHNLDEGVFMRSMGSRGNLGGLAARTWQVAEAMDAFGMDYIIIETVGVGQSEVDIAKMADCTVVTLAPGLGDDIQALKAGILEIAHVFAVNKSDHPAADKLVSELEQMLSMGNHTQASVPVVKCCAAKQEGLELLAGAIDGTLIAFKESGELQNKRLKRMEEELFNYLKFQLEEKIRRRLKELGGLEYLLSHRQDGNIFDLADTILSETI